MKNTNKEIYDIVIIGAGPAGLTAAIYALRFELKIAVIERGPAGGRLLNTNIVENLPGFNRQTGVDIALNFFKHFEELGGKIITDDVLKINKSQQKVKEIHLKSNQKLLTKTILIATGTRPNPLNVAGFEKYYNKGVSNCIVCDGPLYRNCDIAIVGGGISATKEALFALGFVNKIYIINKFSLFGGEPDILRRLTTNPKVELITNTDVLELNGDSEKLTTIKLQNNQTKQITDLPVSAVFVYVGSNPRQEFLANLKLKTKDDFLVVNPLTMMTNINGIYACGDIVLKAFRQITTATGDATNAVLTIKNYLDLN